MNSTASHIPVLLQEVLSFLSPIDSGNYIDCTFGAGSYSKAILDSAKCSVYALDCDHEVALYAEALKAQYKERFTFILENFAVLDKVLHPFLKDGANGVVFDLGVSSMQIDNGYRGFSFLKDGPLDMRMNSEIGITAYDVINRKSEAELSDIIYMYGEDKSARHIAKHIAKKRLSGPINNTKELAELITKAAHGRGKINPATKTFQAIRIYVNNELQALHKGLVAAAAVLKPEGILAVVSFHGLECRVVKSVFRELLNNVHGNEFVIMNKKAITPMPDEIKRNHRSRSAKLRVIKKLGIR
ncbi:Ribosomal RNA small subunit methyltransferase H [Candidatus Xenohaliotis californiensis]|uniref:Ribosomal RNA small subunit methyltransferase H n=1 Tax=Candidatus Xenohaliotis californiensis TaxID=84677 RepID=A0ABP0ERV5_9RICK|nr:Ribosomal RNA small subunit methyltransferase H [Candidatus Xenohaliotis californiensis]